MALYAGTLATGDQLSHAVAAGRHIWVQVATGKVQVDGQDLAEGDGMAITDVSSVTLTGTDPAGAQVLLFDLA